MGLVTKEVTGEEIYEAMKKDGYGVLRETWFNAKGNKVEACILGTAALNLGIAAHNEDEDFVYGTPTLYSQLNKITVPVTHKWYGRGGKIGEIIIEWFDKYHPLEDEIRDYCNKEFIRYSNYKTARKLFLENYKGQIPAGDGINEKFYFLPTWEDALVMAKEILEYVWDKKFKVLVYDYEFGKF